jgi:hypothetical protein
VFARTCYDYLAGELAVAIYDPIESPLSVQPESSGGPLLLRHATPLPRRNVVYFHSGAHNSQRVGFGLHPRRGGANGAAMKKLPS